MKMTPRKDDFEMNASNPNLLRYRRGPFNGHHFFSRSPFRSGYFLVMTAFCLVAVIATLYVMYRAWSRLQFNEFTALIWVAWAGIITSWVKALQTIDRVRQLYVEGSVTEVEPGSPLDVAMGAAAEAINNNLFFYAGSVVFLLFFIAHLFSRCP